MFVVVAALALLAGFPQSGGAVPQPQEPEPPVTETQKSPCPPGEPCGKEASKVPWKQSSDGRWFMPAGARPPSKAASAAPQATAGGPDDFGYTWDDSVALSWIDATTSGIDTGMGGDGSQAVGVSLPFSFKYYENTYNRVYIVGAGYLGFSPASWDDQENIPSPERPNNVIAPYWTLTYLNSTGPSARMYYRSGGSAPNRYFVVEWYDVKGGPPSDSTGGDETYRFEVILWENGDIVFQYQAMTYNGNNWWCGAAGIEDSTGLDGLNYVPYCQKAPSNKAVRFYRPDPSARVAVSPLRSGSFGAPGTTLQLNQVIRNTGELGADTYDLFTSSGWPMTLYESDGVTPLTDTDGDETVDTGLIPQGSSKTIVVKVAVPETATRGQSSDGQLTARSSLNTGKSKTAPIRVAVPAPFAQSYSKNGAPYAGFYRPGGQVTRQTSASYGYNPAVATTPDGKIVQVWYQGRSNSNNVWVDELYYAVLDNQGNIVRPASRITDYSAVT
jgi:hypothetical protein